MKLLGYGTYGRVFLARKRNNGKIYAIKVIDKKNIIRHSQSDLTKLERKILKTIKSRFLIKLYYAFQSKTKLFLVIEYCPGGEFYYYLKILKSFHEKTVKFYALNILFGLKALHDNNIGKHFTLGSPPLACYRPLVYHLGNSRLAGVTDGCTGVYLASPWRLS